VSTNIGSVESQGSPSQDAGKSGVPPPLPQGSGIDVPSNGVSSGNPSASVISGEENVVIQGDQKTNFTIEEVSSFLAGSALPSNLQTAVTQSRLVSQPIVAPVNVQNNSDVGRPPFLPPNFAPNQVRHHQQQQQLWGNTASLSNQNYQRPPFVNHQQYTSSYGVQSTVPLYTPQRASFIPSRLGPASREHGGQQYQDAFQSASMHDLLAINDNNFRSGEALFLPCNFVSHIRGSSRSEDEELLTTVSGAKLYFSNTPRKIQPEKLSYGLFFGANARILARLIPNLTPDLAAYLDYLRKLADLMVNYTTSSVFLLDHVHRYEVVEESKSWNYIDPSLSLNILKKRDSIATTQQQTGNSVNRSNTVSRIGGNANNQQRQHQRSTTVICWLFNQHEGCSYGAGCRFLHICNIVACGLDHPAFKHIFRGQGNQPSSTSQTVAKMPSK
jgi:hypothetical protein